MRIASANAYDTSLDALMRRQTELAGTQEQLTSGKRVNRASDDPAAAARAERALATENRTVATLRGVDASMNAMAATEGAVGDAMELMQQVRETLVAAGNPAYSDAERRGFADKLVGLRAQLLEVANRADGSGNHIFGGQGAPQAPFIDAPGGVAFRGIEGHLKAATDDELALTLDGQRVWMHAHTGNGVFETGPVAGNSGSAWIDGGTVTDPQAIDGATYRIDISVVAGETHYTLLRDGVEVVPAQPFRPGQSIEIAGRSAFLNGNPAAGDAFEMRPSQPGMSVFDVIDQASAALSQPGRTGSQIAQTNARDLLHMDGVMNQLQAVRSQLGETLNRIDNVTDRLGAQKLSSQTARSAAEDLDMVQALSQFANRQTGYDAALKSYSMVQKLSLFDYLR